MRARVPILLSAAVLVVGFYGAWSYVHNYLVYRGFRPPRDPAGLPTGTLEQVGFYSRPLGRRDAYLVYLPHGYSQAARRGVRFPVLYLLHGTASHAMHYIDVGKVGVDVDELLAAHRIRPFLVVMPQAEDGTFVHDTEWANTPHGRYEDAALAVVRNVDSRWSTIRDRAARAIAGLSMGGYGAVNIALHHLGLFGTVESWSGYFTQTRTGPFSHSGQRTLRANSPAFYARALAPRLRRLGLHVLLYSGTHDHVSQQQDPFATELRGLGVRVRSLHFRGAHNWRLWRGKMPLALRYASRRLFAARRPETPRPAPPFGKVESVVWISSR
jgi:enterochelin esterase-like enzyme